MATTDKVAELYEHYNQLDNAKEEISNVSVGQLIISEEKAVKCEFL